MAIEATESDTILTAAKNAGIHIPTMCWLEDKDPLESYRQYMVSEKIVGSRDDLTEIDDKIEKQLQEIVREVLESPFPEPDVGLEDVYAR